MIIEKSKVSGLVVKGMGKRASRFIPLTTISLTALQPLIFRVFPLFRGSKNSLGEDSGVLFSRRRRQLQRRRTRPAADPNHLKFEIF